MAFYWLSEWNPTVSVGLRKGEKKKLYIKNNKSPEILSAWLASSVPISPPSTHVHTHKAHGLIAVAGQSCSQCLPLTSSQCLLCWEGGFMLIWELVVLRSFRPSRATAALNVLFSLFFKKKKKKVLPVHVCPPQPWQKNLIISHWRVLLNISWDILCRTQVLPLPGGSQYTSAH